MNISKYNEYLAKQYTRSSNVSQLPELGLGRY